MPFCFAIFPRRQDQNCSAQFLAVCWIVCVDFKAHRLRDGFSVSHALLLSQSIPTFIGHNLDKLEMERLSKDAICSSLFRCSSRTVRLSFDLFLFFLDFGIGSFLHLVHRRSRRLKARILYSKKTSASNLSLDMRHICVYYALSRVSPTLGKPE